MRATYTNITVKDDISGKGDRIGQFSQCYTY